MAEKSKDQEPSTVDKESTKDQDREADQSQDENVLELLSTEQPQEYVLLHIVSRPQGGDAYQPGDVLSFEQLTTEFGNAGLLRLAAVGAVVPRDHPAAGTAEQQRLQALATAARQQNH